MPTTRVMVTETVDYAVPVTHPADATPQQIVAVAARAFAADTDRDKTYYHHVLADEYRIGGVEVVCDEDESEDLPVWADSPVPDEPTRAGGVLAAVDPGTALTAALADVLRAADMTPDAYLPGDHADVWDGWDDARLILVDEPAAQRLTTRAPNRRDGVIVVCHGTPPDTIWQHAVAIGAEHVIALPDGHDWLTAALTGAAPAAAPERAA